MSETHCKTHVRKTHKHNFQPINDRCCGDKGGEFQCQFHENKVCIETDWEGTHNIHCSKDWTCRMNSTRYVFSPGIQPGIQPGCFNLSRENNFKIF